MTDETTANETNEKPNELQILKERAKLMGIKFSNNISVDALRAKITAKMEGENEAETEAVEDEAEDAEADGDTEINDADLDGQDDDTGQFVEGNQAAAKPPRPRIVHNNEQAKPARPKTKAEREMELRKKIHDEEMALVRVRITNMDPKKANLPGEILTVANEYLGTVRKFVPYGEQTDNGYHIPRCLFNQMEERKFLMIRTIKDKRTGTFRPETRWMKEFALEVLPPLTEKELERLATAQMAAGSSEEFA